MAKRNRQTTTTREGAQLDSRLSDYSAVARISAGAGGTRGRFGNWPIFAAAAGSALAMATGASASIITGTYNGATVQPQGPNSHASNNGPSTVHASSIKGLYFGIGNDHVGIKAQSGKALTTQGNAVEPFGRLSVLAVSPVRIFFTSASLVKNFAAGSKIAGLNVAASAKIVNAFYTGAAFGEFASGQAGYAGLAINIGGGNVDYGWLKLVFTDNIDGLPNNLTVLSYGIETTANASITAGETADGASTPEPGTSALALLASGAAGVLALKRRRKQTQAVIIENQKCLG